MKTVFWTSGTRIMERRDNTEALEEAIGKLREAYLAKHPQKDQRPHEDETHFEAHPNAPYYQDESILDYTCYFIPPSVTYEDIKDVLGRKEVEYRAIRETIVTFPSSFNVSRSVIVELSDQEKQAVMRNVFSLESRIEELEAEKKEVLSRIKHEIEEASKERLTAKNKFLDGKKEVSVMCSVRVDYEKRETYFINEAGDVIDHDEISAQEAQYKFNGPLDIVEESVDVEEPSIVPEEEENDIPSFSPSEPPVFGDQNEGGSFLEMTVEEEQQTQDGLSGNDSLLEEGGVIHSIGAQPEEGDDEITT